MPPSQPRDPKTPKGARRPPDEPIEDRSEDRSTLEIRGGTLNLSLGEHNSSDQRDTIPPPLPVSEYVQTMMQQADTDEPSIDEAPLSWHGEPSSSRAPLSWRGEPPLSWRARGLDPNRPPETEE